MLTQERKVALATLFFLFSLYFTFRTLYPQTATSQAVVGHDRQLEHQNTRFHPAQEPSLQAAGDGTGSSTHSSHSATTPDPDSLYAYVFYATTDQYACSVLVNVRRLQIELFTTLPIHVLASSSISEAYLSAFRDADVTVHIQEPPQMGEGVSGYYKDCMLKLLAFEMHKLEPGLKRVLALDSDQLIMQNLDHLFTGLPDVDLAAPRAYWLGKDTLTSTFMMINLSDRLWDQVHGAMETVGLNEFDMDLVNNLLGDTVMMLGGEFVTLNSHWEDWTLPKWYHPQETINMTTVKIINDMAKNVLQAGKRDELYADPPAQADEASTPLSVIEADAMTRDYPLAIQTAPFLPAPTAPPTFLPPPKILNTGKQKTAITSPRFPDQHPLSIELQRLITASSVIHFTALGKPWYFSVTATKQMRPDAHPGLSELVGMWREAAAEVCPEYRADGV